jgi:hypothetical protein
MVIRCEIKVSRNGCSTDWNKVVKMGGRRQDQKSRKEMRQWLESRLRGNPHK